MNTSRPIELSPENLESLCAYLEAGLSRRLAANAVALLEEELQHWIDENPQREAILGAAEAKFQLRCLESILAAGEGKSKANVRALMWLLECRFPEQYGKKRTPRSEKKPQQDSPAPAATKASTPTQAIPPTPKPTNIAEVPDQLGQPFRNPHSEIRNHPAPAQKAAPDQRLAA